jgi:hypothetical protein
MPRLPDNFFELKRDEALAILAVAKEKAKYEPDTFVQVKGQPAKFLRRRKIVEQDSEGNWKPASARKKL